MGQPGYAAGAAYILVKNGSTWSVQQKIHGNNTGMGDQFGFDVAISADGNTAVVGAPGEDNDNAAPNNTGALYVFTRTGTTWTEDDMIHGSTPYQNQDLGKNIDISDDGSAVTAGSI